MRFPFERSVKDLLSNTQIIVDKETSKARMIWLIKLKAAPGQENCAMFAHFLMVKKWIGDRQTVLDWPLAHLPKNDAEFLKLGDEVYEFSRRQENDPQREQEAHK